MDTARIRRIWYVVRPVDGLWEVTFGAERGHFVYRTRDEAVAIARDAAHLHHDNRGEPAGARLDLPGETPHVVATFGKMPHLVRQRTG
jgi:hypothetical protein